MGEKDTRREKRSGMRSITGMRRGMKSITEMKSGMMRTNNTGMSLEMNMEITKSTKTTKTTKITKVSRSGNLTGKEADMINFESGSEQEHLQNFNKISRDIKVFEDEYKECIQNIHDQVFTEEEIEECVGKDFRKVILDIKYETLKILSRGDARTKEFYLEYCYKPAGTNEQFATACDTMEKDVLDLLWNAMDFVEICRLNEDKYLSVISAMPRHNFEEIMNNLTEFSAELFELLDEVDSHKEVLILRLKTLIDDRTKLIIEAAQENAENPQPKIIHHTINIVTEVKDKNYNLDKLPGDQFAINLDNEANDMEQIEEGGEGVDYKTRKLGLNRRKNRALETIQEKNQKIEALRKRNGGRYTRLFSSKNGKYHGLNKEMGHHRGIQ